MGIWIKKPTEASAFDWSGAKPKLETIDGL